MLSIFMLVALPALLALLMLDPLRERWTSSLHPAWLISSALAISFVGFLLIGFESAIVNDTAVVHQLTWVPDYNLTLSFYLDSLALLFTLIITGVGTVVFLYAGYYFDDPDERDRFLRLLLLFTSAMLWLVTSGNLITLFIAWELTSIISFLLIGFKGAKYESARLGASRALIVTGGGGLALLGGILLLGVAGGTYELSALLTQDLTDHRWYVPLVILLGLGAFTKSAQFPFHFWLPGAMDAPTPASSFLHSATMVKAGVYLLARMHPVLGDGAFWSNTLLAVGLTTMLYSAVLAIRQPDLKGLLAFTTTGKLGALVALLGVPGGYGVKAALVGILAHALYKSALFLCVGNVDHATGTRQVSKLGGLWKAMPITGFVVIISALSMAGVPPLLGFVAKETLLEAFFSTPFTLLIVFISSVLTGTAGYILIFDVFFGKMPDELHPHALQRPLEGSLLLLATGTIVIALFVTQLLTPFFDALIPVEFKLVLFPGFNNVFWLSMAAIGGGAVLYFARNAWRNVPDAPINATQIYDVLVGRVEWLADQTLKTQNGKLRHYLIVVIGVTMAIFLYGGVVGDALRSDFVLGSFTIVDVMDVMLLVLAVATAWLSILVRRHISAALALAVFGYALGGVFLVEPAPDVALVQFLVETLATVVLIIMISRIQIEHRSAAISANTPDLTRRGERFAQIRDISIAVVTGVVMTAFAFVALSNRANRDSIAAWHLENAEPEIGVTDVVSAILTDFRGTDTLIEIMVFATAILGVLALLTINRAQGGEPQNTQEMQGLSSILSTPMTRIVTSIVLPITLVISVVHILYGANAPGDGFTAGVVAGLGVTLYFVVFGYNQAERRLWWVQPTRFIVAGFTLALLNALLPVFFGGAFMGLIDFAPGLDFAGLKFTTTIVFEIAIALTVFGGVSLLMETIASPSTVYAFDEQPAKSSSKQATDTPPTAGDDGSPIPEPTS